MNTVYDRLRKASSVPVETVMEDIHIICADDNDDTLALMKFHCDRLDWKGHYVQTALGIIDTINESSIEFDAIVADINFKHAMGPDVTGITVARTIRKVRPNVPIIFVSAYVNSIIREEVRRVNAEVVPKPVDFDKLFEQIASMIYWHRLSSSEFYKLGEDRRKTSINTTGWARRRTDAFLEPSQTVIGVLSEAKNAK